MSPRYIALQAKSPWPIFLNKEIHVLKRQLKKKACILTVI